MLLVEIEHHFIIHLIDMISRQNQHIVRVKTLHVVNILIDRIGCACIPFAVLALLIRRKDGNAADIPVQIPRNTDSDMRIQAKGLILRQHSHRVNTRINAVAQRKIDNPVFPAKRYCRLGHFRGQHTQSASLPACQQHSNHFFLNHVITSCFCITYHMTLRFLLKRL